MHDERQSSSGRVHSARKPPWFRSPLRTGGAFAYVAAVLTRHRTVTVCVEAQCPNRRHCFARGTATFMILGDRCTRACRFCAVSHGTPRPPEPDEPRRVTSAAADLGLAHVVVTSVTRDDLADGGASCFAGTIGAVTSRSPGTPVEVLVPDFGGDMTAADTVLAAGPAVFAHNMETVSRLYGTVRPGAEYGRSLGLLAHAVRHGGTVVKSGCMLGLGETEDDIRRLLGDVADTGCSLFTIGQYLQPSPAHLPVGRWVHPDEFERWRETALAMGFANVMSGPLVRSSYRAGEMYRAAEGGLSSAAEQTAGNSI